MKQLLSSMLLCTSIILSAQSGDLKNEFGIGPSISFVTTGDRGGFHFTNSYHRSVLTRFDIGITFGYLTTMGESSLLLNEPPSNYTNNIATGDWGLTSEDGIKILDLNTEQQTYIHSDLSLRFKTILRKSFGLDINLGVSLAYINLTYITRWELGTFEGEASGAWDLQLVYPYYSRVIDIGAVGGIDFYYLLEERFKVGVYVGGNTYPKSGIRFYDLGLKCGLRF